MKNYAPAVSFYRNPFQYDRLWLVLFWCLFLAVGCATARPAPETAPPPPASPSAPKPYKVLGQWYQPRAHAHGFRQVGIASWYGDEFHGRRTSNGEIYDMHAISAAHKTLPFNTVVSVHNLGNGRKLDVRINDRGPFVRGRIIDLSYAAAKHLGIVDAGTAKVEIVALGSVDGSRATDLKNQTYKPVDYNTGRFTFQVGAFRDRRNAEKLRAKLDQTYKNAHISVYDSADGIFYRVRVGDFSTLDAARQGEEMLIRSGYEPIIVAE
jgi:rare lipoprotein A